MTTRVFDISQSDELKKYLDKGFEEGAERAILSTALKVVQNITTAIIPAFPRPPVDRGAYRAGWRAKPIARGAEIVNTLPHASIIEYGARAQNVKIGKAMIDALAAWVRRKGIVRGRGKQSKLDALQVAWAIARAMQKKGIYGPRGLRVLEKALKGVPSILNDEFKREMKDFHA